MQATVKDVYDKIDDAQQYIDKLLRFINGNETVTYTQDQAETLADILIDYVNILLSLKLTKKDSKLILGEDEDDGNQET